MIKPNLKLPPIPDGRIIRETGTAVETGDLVPTIDGWTQAAAVGHRVSPGEIYLRKTRDARRAKLRVEQ